MCSAGSEGAGLVIVAFALGTVVAYMRQYEVS